MALLTTQGNNMKYFNTTFMIGDVEYRTVAYDHKKNRYFIRTVDFKKKGWVHESSIDFYLTGGV